jgi:hypothetical protein
MAFRLCVLFAPLGLLLVAGCGSGEYLDRLKKSEADYRRKEPFLALAPEQQLGATPVYVRVPNGFNVPAEQEGVKVSSQRLKPNVLTLPGIEGAFEKMVDKDNTKKSGYVYFGVCEVPLEKKKPNFAAVEKDLLDEFNGKLDLKTKVKWEDAPLPSPEGQTVAWRKVRGEKTQGFYATDISGQGGVEQLPGVVELYVLPAEGVNRLVWMLWRVPKDLEAEFKVADLAKAAGGSVRIQPPEGESQ